MVDLNIIRRLLIGSGVYVEMRVSTEGALGESVKKCISVSVLLRVQRGEELRSSFEISGRLQRHSSQPKSTVVMPWRDKEDSKEWLRQAEGHKTQRMWIYRCSWNTAVIVAVWSWVSHGTAR